METKKESVDLKEFLEEKINALEKLIETKLCGIGLSTKVAADELARRLDKFPEQFITKPDYEKAHDKIKDDYHRILSDLTSKVEPSELIMIKEQLAAMRAKEGSTAKIITLAVSLTTIVVALIAIVTHAIFTR